jgi:galactose mutarotase-like enzyme
LASTPPLKISSDLLLAEINPLGAELVRLTTRDGHELLWDGDVTWWAGHAPILFPIVGTLNRGRYRLNDNTFAMPKHGFARNSVFDLVEISDGEATLRLQDSDASRAIYPFAFRLAINVELSGPALTVTARVTNRDVRAMPVSFGFHPALRWPLPFGGARDDHRVIFSSDEPAPVRRINSEGLLDPTAHTSPVTGRILWLRDELFVDDAIIFDRLHSAALEYRADDFPAIVMTFANLPHLGVWTKPGAGFICIEPWQGYNDPEGFEGDIWSKPGIIAVAPGITSEFSMNISIEGLP